MKALLRIVFAAFLAGGLSVAQGRTDTGSTMLSQPDTASSGDKAAGGDTKKEGEEDEEPDCD